MKTSVIRYRVADFLKTHAPFDLLPEQDLLDLAGSGRVKFHEADEHVFRQGGDTLPLVWVIQQGRVDLIDERPGGDQLWDVLGEGDLIGLERFLGGASYPYSARTATDVILYSLDAAQFEALLSRYPAVKRFVNAHASASATAGGSRSSWLDFEAPPADFLRSRLVTVRPEPTLAEAASRWNAAGNGAVAVVDAKGRAVGLITAAEISTAVARSSALIPRQRPPVVASETTTREAVREMVRARSEVLAITSGGSPESPLESLLTASDLALFCGRNPASLLSAIVRAASVAEMAPLLAQGTRIVLDGLARSSDVDDCARIGAEIVAALAEAGIRLAQEEAVSDGMTMPTVPYCWLTFGSAARGETLRPTLPNLAVVYDDSNPTFTAQTGAFFAAVAGRTAVWLHACGLTGSGTLWPEGAQASMPVSEWKRFYRETIHNPLEHDLFARRELFDLRPLSGERWLVEELRRSIVGELQKRQVLIPLLANDTLSHQPPLTFFRGLALELDGTPRSSFDIAETVLGPISDAARTFALAKNQVGRTSTLERIQAAAADWPDHAAVFQGAAEAFRIALYHQTVAGASRIDPATLDRYDQRLFKTALSSIVQLLELTTSTFGPAA